MPWLRPQVQDIRRHGTYLTNPRVETTAESIKIIHLEYGTCDSGVDHLDLNATAAECRMWSHFIDEDYREDMLDSNDLQDIYSDKVYPYKCPTCDAAMPKLSSLFQHVESPACGQTLNEGAIGRLRRFLYSRYG